MIIFEANISLQVCIFLKEYLKNTFSFVGANQKMLNEFGINTFFDNEEEFQKLKDSVSMAIINKVEEQDRAEYGDFQTNKELAFKIVKQLFNNQISPEIVIEPTCGKGNFIIASLSRFNNTKKIFGIEIYKPYVWETKFSIIDFYLSNPNHYKPEITIIHSDIFHYNFKSITQQVNKESLLIIGNPPWITNSKLGSLNSLNLPPKSNFKNYSGLDAITGKGNFDIAEYITFMLFEAFQYHNGYLALLVKNSVIKNIIFDQNENKFRIGKIEKYSIDSKREFNVSVEASLLFCQFNSIPSIECKEYNFYDKNPVKSFGWLNSKFVSNISYYNATKSIDGLCPFEWRQGLKHDCSSVMELERSNGYFINKLSDEIAIEDDLVYGLLKSSDLKNSVINDTRKYTIVTQTRVGQDTSYIRHLYPKTYHYLSKNISFFNSRKSSIYRGKPLFSIFGIGDYSFKPYKVAISGLYKTFHFTLVLPQRNRPVMLDDTCYFIGFDRIDFAVYAIILLNYNKTEEFLKSITFSDAKRVFTKDLLMRLDLLNISKSISPNEVQEQVTFLNKKYHLNIDLSQWDSFIELMTPVKEKQMTISDLSE